jgi:hypothetical protein
MLNMSKLINETLKNKIDWEGIKNTSIIRTINNNEYDVNVIIPFKGRYNFLNPVIDSFLKSFSFYNEISEIKKKFILTVVEHDVEPYGLDYMVDSQNYMWSSWGIFNQFNRSFCFNFGFKFSNKSKYYLLHDVDVVVQKDYFVRLFKNLKNFKCIQSYGNRHIWYMSEKLTQSLLKSEIDVELITKDNHDVSPPHLTGSKGGSIFLDYETFFNVGGFDPELFCGYAAEDQFFWEKCLTFLGSIGYCDDPIIDIFHMNHPPTSNTNPLLYEMEEHLHEFNRMSHEDKITFINFKKNILNE